MTDNTPLSWQYLKAMAAWISNPAYYLYGMWNSPTPGLHANGSVTPGEGGVDLPAPQGTPIYALATGPIVGIGQWKDKEHQVITQRVNVPGAGAQDLYYQHLYLAPGLQPGQIVQKGQQIGTVGSFGETEMGFNAAWGGIYGDKHPGPWARDPRPLLRALMTDKSPSVAPSSSGSTQNTTSSGVSMNLLDPSTWLPTLKVYGEYIAVFVIALILFIVGMFLLAEKPATDVAKKVIA